MIRRADVIKPSRSKPFESNESYSDFHQLSQLHKIHSAAVSVHGPPFSVTIPPNGHSRFSIDCFANFSLVSSIFHAAVALSMVLAKFRSLALYRPLLFSTATMASGSPFHQPGKC